MVGRILLSVLILFSTLCSGYSAAGVQGFVGVSPALTHFTTSFVGTSPLYAAGIVNGFRGGSGSLRGGVGAAGGVLGVKRLSGLRGSAGLLGSATGMDRGVANSAWAVLVGADGHVGSPTRLLHPPGCPDFDIDAVKKAARAEFAAKLGGFDAADLLVSKTKDGPVLSEDVDVSTLQQGKTRAEPLYVIAPKPGTGLDRSAWVKVVLPGRGETRPVLVASPTRDVPWTVNELRRAVKAECAVKLQDTDADDLVATDGEGGAVLEEDVLVSDLSKGKTKEDPLLIHTPKPVAAKVIRYWKENFYEPSVVREASVLIEGQQAFDNWLRNMQVGALSCNPDSGQGTMDFQELDEGLVYWLDMGTALLKGVRRLEGWRENQDRALEDEVTRFVGTHLNTSHAPLMCRPDLREVKSTANNRTFEWDGILCNGKYVFVVEAKQNVFVNTLLHPMSEQDTICCVTDTVTTLLGKWNDFTKALRAGELEHFGEFQHCEVFLFLGGRNFPMKARDVCAHYGVYAVYPSGSNFQLAAPGGLTP
mmetsp:Transcript_42557/g.83203  ORF Transcript_42557/g.83203 Transcript_42557/m.83203 type:complete len:533 (+) Transcript_42557:220-1818(+)